MLENVAAYVVNDILFKDIVDKDAKAVEGIAHEEGARQPGNQPKIACCFATHDVVDDQLDKPGKGEGKAEGNQRAADVADSQPSVWPQINRDPPHDFEGRAGGGAQRG